MKTYLINLDRATDRASAMQMAFAAINLPFERVSAIDAESLTHADRRTYCDNDALSNGTVCCFLSHRRCWQKLVESGEPFCAVFEDDAVFGKAAQAIFSSLDWLPASFDIIKLETYMRDTVVEKRAFVEIQGHSLRLLKAEHVGTVGYIISRQCAQRLLTESDKFSVPVDHFMFRAGKGPFADLNVLQMFPAICIQQQFMSVEAPASMIAPSAKAKLLRAAKLKRELMRPFKKIAYRVRAAVMNRFSGQLWGKVPFGQ